MTSDIILKLAGGLYGSVLECNKVFPRGWLWVKYCEADLCNGGQVYLDCHRWHLKGFNKSQREAGWLVCQLQKVCRVNCFHISFCIACINRQVHRHYFSVIHMSVCVSCVSLIHMPVCEQVKTWVTWITVVDRLQGSFVCMISFKCRCLGHIFAAGRFTLYRVMCP